MREKIIGIYGVLHRPSGRWYVGLSTDVQSRWNQHLYAARQGADQAFCRALRKYPSSDFTWMVLEVCSLAEFAAREVAWIQKLEGFTKGFNSTAGGDFNPMHTLEVRAKVSAALKGKPFSLQHRANIARGQKGKPKFQTLQHKANAAAARAKVGIKDKIAWRLKLSKAMAGRRLSSEECARRSATARRGQFHRHFGGSSVG